ncbi:MAG: hypothetical protein AAGC86_15755 [Pseudomonadota bacterium]
MYESTTTGQTQGTVHVAAVAKVAREARWSLDAPRSYLVPSLFWFASGHGRIMIDGGLRGFTSSNALYIPPNTPHAVEIAPRTQGIAVFFNAASGLTCPETVIHLRLYGMGRQAELTRMIDELSREAASGAPDSDNVLFHQSALLMHWLKRRDGSMTTTAQAPQPCAPTTARVPQTALGDPKRAGDGQRGS